MTPRQQPSAMEANPKPQGVIPADGFPYLLEEIYGIKDLKRDDWGLANQILTLKMAERDVDKLRHGPAELQNAIRNAKAAFLDRVYQAIAVHCDLEFLDQLIRVVEYFEKRNTTGVKNPSEAAIKKECALAAFRLILNSKDKLPTRPQIKERLREKGIRVDRVNWPRVWKSLGLNDPAFAGPRGRPKSNLNNR
jgi:hypothetical protein